MRDCGDVVVHWRQRAGTHELKVAAALAFVNRATQRRCARRQRIQSAATVE